MATGGVCTKCTDRWSRFTKEGHLWSIRKRRHTREASSVSLTKKGCILSITNQEKSGPSIMDSSKRKGVPIYVMMPTNTFRIDRCGVARIRRYSG
ncbi:hypothetical protein QJS10_CPA08g01792 [Acorus calamus]|uniref:Uncharacterized protein n=1 Tax=Acorus calamus TaxID=4465 RepID=A0AAV9EF81_ACOCL|nr:hypothetical protein QJS10_CPA08g01792 [Acorus calamus]